MTRILEGGVQRAGDRVRITVQLIDAGTDAHLWAETYDRELTAANIFAIQSEVAAAIAAALKTTLTAAEKARVNVVPTQNLEAWEAYPARPAAHGAAHRARPWPKRSSSSGRRSNSIRSSRWPTSGLADSLTLQIEHAGAHARTPPSPGPTQQSGRPWNSTRTWPRRGRRLR